MKPVKLVLFSLFALMPIGLHFHYLIFCRGSHLNGFCYQIAREVLDAAARVIRPGVTTDEIDRVVHEATIAAGFSTF